MNVVLSVHKLQGECHSNNVQWTAIKLLVCHVIKCRRLEGLITVASQEAKYQRGSSVVSLNRKCSTEPLRLSQTEGSHLAFSRVFFGRVFQASGIESEQHWEDEASSFSTKG